MLSYLELRRAARIISPLLAGAGIHRIVQADEYCLAAVFRGGERERILLLSCRPEFGRLSLCPETPKAPAMPPTFAQYARAHLSHAAFRDLAVASTNRQVSLRLLAPEGSFEVILSLLGARSNIYILDHNDRLAHALRPLEETRRELVLGGLWTDPQGTLPSGGIDRWEGLSDETYVEELEKSYRRMERERAIETLSRKLENSLGKEAAFLDRKAANLQEDLGEVREAARHKHRGELLKGVLHTIRPGDENVEAVDYETGEKLSIALDPTLSPAQNLEAYFGRYQKELRGVAALEQQVAAVQTSQSGIEALQEEMRRLLSGPEPDLGSLRSFADQPRLRRLLARYYPARSTRPAVQRPAGKKDLPSRLQPKRYRTADGLEIWVGRSDEGNDYLTTRLARGNDLFLHLEGYPGSHVILRTEGKKDPPSEAVLAACELAVHFSRLKEAGRADVHVAFAKDVKKPKGVKRGLVYVIRGKTIHLRRDAKRLEDILASRLDD